MQRRIERLEAGAPNVDLWADCERIAAKRGIPLAEVIGDAMQIDSRLQELRKTGLSETAALQVWANEESLDAEAVLSEYRRLMSEATHGHGRLHNA